LNASREGTLSASGCAFDGRGEVRYRISISDRRELVITLQSADFHPQLLLLAETAGSAGTQIDEKASGGSDRATLRRSLSKGTYQIVVTSEALRVGGKYLLEISERQRCPAQHVSLPAEIKNFLAPKCQTSDGDWLLNQFTFSLDAPTPVTAELETSVSNMRLLLSDSRGQPIAGDSSKVITKPLDPGDYVVALRAKTGGSGPYVLRLHQTCSPREVTSLNLTDSLAPGDCHIKEYPGGGSEDFPARLYKFRLSERSQFSSQITSAAGTIGMTLTTSENEKIADSASGSLSRALRHGTYLLWVASHGTTTTSYHLSATFVPQPCRPTQFSSDASLQASIGVNDCSVNDLFPLISDTTPAKLYEFHSTASSTLYFRQAGANPSEVLVFDRDMKPVVENREIRDGAEMVPLGAGDYYFLVRPVLGSTATFSLRIERQSCLAQRDTQVLELGRRRQGEFSSKSCIVRGYAFDIYSINLTSPASFQITVDAPSLALTLALGDENGKRIDLPVANTQGSASIEGIAEAGTYRLAVGSGGSSFGAYSLSSVACPLQDLPFNVPNQFGVLRDFSSSLCLPVANGYRQKYLLRLTSSGVLNLTVSGPVSVSLRSTATRQDIQLELLTGTRTKGPTRFTTRSALAPGTYLLEVASRGGPGQQYHLSAQVK
jgi:hypothetical protein